MSLTFEQLPDAVEQVNNRLERIEALLSQSSRHPVKENKLLRLPEAAKYCGGMPIPTFRKHLSDGNVIGSKPGKHWIFSIQDLDNFIMKFRKKTREEIMEEAENLLISK